MFIHFLDPLQDTRLEFFEGIDADMPQEASRHFGEGALDQIQPGAVFRGVNVLEAPGSGRQISHGFFRDVGGMIVQNDTQGSFWRVICVDGLKQGDKFTAPVTFFDLGEEMAGVQVNPAQNGCCAVRKVKLSGALKCRNPMY